MRRMLIRRGGLRVRGCCCGCSLKTGTIIIATLQAVGGLGIALAMARNVLAAASGAQVALVSARNHGLTGNEARDVDRLLAAELRLDPRALSAAMAALGALQFVFSLMLIYGANNESPALVRPWVAFAAGTTLLGALVYVAVALLARAAGAEGVAEAVIIGLLPACGTMLYFILVVNSFYLELLEARIGRAGACAAPGPSPLIDSKGPPPAVL